MKEENLSFWLPAPEALILVLVPVHFLMKQEKLSACFCGHLYLDQKPEKVEETSPRIEV